MRDIFISHVSSDSAIALGIAAWLEKQGYSTWYYERDSDSGPSYLSQTRQGILESQAMIVLISPATLASPSQVDKEIIRAHEGRKHLIPLLHEVTDAEYKQAQPDWEQAMGAATSLAIPNGNIDEIMPRVLRGLTKLGVKPGGGDVTATPVVPKYKPANKGNGNKLWMGISAILLLIILAGGAFYLFSEPEPDYSKYLTAITKGDELLRETKFEEAKKEYKSALKWNPGDSAVLRKLELMEEVKQLVLQKKNAQSVFELILKVEASPGLSADAQAIIGKTYANKTFAPIVLKLKWVNGMLEISIVGGLPSDNPEQPYIVKGIECTNCIKWEKLDTGYVGIIEEAKVSVKEIKAIDSRGEASSVGFIPSRMAAVTPASPSATQPVKVDETPVANASTFDGYIKEGNTQFKAGNYEGAKANYEQALKLNAKADSVQWKITACNKAILLGEISLVAISAGTFEMGYAKGGADDKTVHAVTLKKFRLSKTEITVKQYRRYCDFTGHTMPAGAEADDKPITNITWFEARDFCEWLSGHLPTEAEWEYAASEAGKSNTLYSGSDEISRVAIYKSNSGGTLGRVGKMTANALQLYDMTGNAAEWCSDWYDKDYYNTPAASKPNPTGPVDGTKKSFRGGCYSDIRDPMGSDPLRVTYRNSRKPGDHLDFIGFRAAFN